MLQKMASCTNCHRYTSILPNKTVCGRCDQKLNPRTDTRKFRLERTPDGLGFIPVTANGFILPKEEWTNTKRKIERFYNQKSYDDIEEMNEQIRLKKKEEGATKPVSSEGYVYLIRAGQYHKIGISRNIKDRMGAIQLSIPEEKIVLIHYVWCGHPFKVERGLHRFFELKRLNGEWFDLTVDDVEWFKKLESKTVYEKVWEALTDSLLDI